ncbi:ABC transporter permease subunit [Bosea vaviloviae]|uniref:ABC transporter permease subunit n=1 Tax=Bosea vaviloviae TaxID=1526658 RepID=UPI0009F52612|nr:ABC transporter permease subunit [Bosea vaviloviae]
MLQAARKSGLAFTMAAGWRNVCAVAFSPKQHWRVVLVTKSNKAAYVAPLILLGPVLLFVAAFYLVPLVQLFGGSFRVGDEWTLDGYRQTLSQAAFVRIFFRTLTLSIIVTIICLLIGYPLAYQLSKVKGRAAAILLLLVSLPYMTSVLIRTYAWVIILAPNGVVNKTLLGAGLIQDPLDLVFNTFGVYVGMVQIQLPLMVFPLYAAMMRVDRSLIDAAANLGSNPVSAFLHAFAPLTAPGIVSGCTLVFLSCLGFYVTPALLGGAGDYMLAQGITVRVTALADFVGATTQSVILLSIVIAMLIIFRSTLAPDTGEDRSTKKLAAKNGTGLTRYPDALESLRCRIHPFARSLSEALAVIRTPLLWATTVLAFVFLLVPLLVIFPLAFSSASYLTFPPPGYSLRWFNTFISNDIWLRAAWFSIQTCLLASLFAVALSVPAAYAIVRQRAPARIAIYILLISPIVLPHVVLALGLYFFLGKIGLLGTKAGFVIAYTVVGIPYALIAIVGGLRQLDASLERAAQSLGATPITAFRTVTLPLLLPSLLSAIFFSFIMAFDDVILGLFLGGPSSVPLSVRMWEDIKQEISPQVSVVAVIFFAALAAAYLVHQLLSLRTPAVGNTLKDD